MKVEPELGTTVLHCRPNILQLHTMISRCFDKIIKVGTTIPKIETILFPELEHAGYLFPVSRYESEVSEELSNKNEKKMLTRKSPCRIIFTYGEMNNRNFRFLDALSSGADDNQ